MLSRNHVIFHNCQSRHPLPALRSRLLRRNHGGIAPRAVAAAGPNRYLDNPARTAFGACARYRTIQHDSVRFARENTRYRREISRIQSESSRSEPEIERYKPRMSNLMKTNAPQISCESVELSAGFVELSCRFALESCAFAPVSCGIDQNRAKASKP